MWHTHDKQVVDQESTSQGHWQATMKQVSQDGLQALLLRLLCDV